MTQRALSLALLTMISLATHTLFADVIVSPIYSDGVVLQRGIPLLVWGKAKPGETIKITLGKDVATAIADEQGLSLIHI